MNGVINVKNDDVKEYNQKRWKAMADADALFTRPTLELNRESAQAFVNKFGLLGELKGKNVLCLAGGGGQQSVAFALLGAAVTVLDLSPEQLERDRLAAEHYGVQIYTMEGDMRDLGMLPNEYFDVIWQPYSINFVPNCVEVFRQVAERIREDGIYYLMCANPFVHGMDETSWNGRGYPIENAYKDGEKLIQKYQHFVFASTLDASNVPPSVEYRHTLSTIMNGLVANGFDVVRLVEELPDEPGEPGSWQHFTAFAPPWLHLWSRRQRRGDEGGAQ